MLFISVFKNLGEKSPDKNSPVSLLAIVVKLFKKLVSNRLEDHVEKCSIFLISSMGSGNWRFLSQLYLR